MLKNNNGFTLPEVLIASSLLLMVITTFVPIFSLLNTERSILTDRRTITYQLHDELQYFLWENPKTPPVQFTDTIQHKKVNFHFTTENDFIKGCANWNNVKQTKEIICLYGYVQK